MYYDGPDIYLFNISDENFNCCNFRIWAKKDINWNSNDGGRLLLMEEANFSELETRNNNLFFQKRPQSTMVGGLMVWVKINMGDHIKKMFYSK